MVMIMVVMVVIIKAATAVRTVFGLKVAKATGDDTPDGLAGFRMMGERIFSDALLDLELLGAFALFLRDRLVGVRGHVPIYNVTCGSSILEVKRDLTPTIRSGTSEMV